MGGRTERLLFNPTRPVHGISHAGAAPVSELRYPVIELKKENRKEAVCLVFEKVNTGGGPLSVFELVTATYAADGTNLRDEWYGNREQGIEGFRPRFARQRLLRDIEPTDFLQGLSLLETYRRHREDRAAGKTGKQVTGVSAKREAVLGLPLRAYEEFKEPLFDGFCRVAQFLRRESFFSRRDLPYRTQLIPLAAVLTLFGDRWLEPQIYAKIARWFWCGVFGELYGGAVETRMATDLQQLMTWFEDDAAEPATVQDAHFQPARLDTLRTRNSAAYKGLNVLLQRHGARDWFWQSTIRDLDEMDWDEYRLEIHHIFPRAWCEARDIDPRTYNSILNKTPLSYRTNRMIGANAPSDYLRQIQRHKNVRLNDAEMDALVSTYHLEPSLLRADDFAHFVENRRQHFIDEIARVMGKPVVETGEAVAEDAVDDQSVA